VFEDSLRTIAIEHVSPEIDGGRHAVKRIVGDLVRVEADIFKEGHDLLCAAILWRKQGDTQWNEAPMALFDNDRWAGSFVPHEIGLFEYVVEAWVDLYGSWVQEVRKKFDAGEQVSSELLEGRRLIEQAASRASKQLASQLRAWLANWDSKTQQAERVELACESSFVELLRTVPDRQRASRYDCILGLVVDRERARFGTWYEMFTRSQGTDPTRGSTFRECEARLSEIRKMGFDVIYLPPIHPIGVTNRKGKNNATVAAPGDPGSPYATGSSFGGHKAIAPELGTLDDFAHFIAACDRLGMEVAIDFAIQCSPDHPYVKEHPEWFFKRPDGSIKFAENPPKKYQDIYPLDFSCAAWKSLWQEMFDILDFWAERGVRIFRVDNPHTKPLPFWKWLIAGLKKKHPDLIFFAEAFTRPKMMKLLGKVGFTQSYTYFTWRNTKHELTEYLTELTQTEMRDYYRGNFFTNTPDILPFFLQSSGRPGFKIRAVLAATLSSSYGIYNGFELCENRALKGREEYADSEKYEYKVWDWDRPGNIKDLITTINRARAQHKALQGYDNLRFYRADNDDILAYSKTDPGTDDSILVVVNLNPHEVRDCLVHIDPWDFGLGEHDSYVVHDLITGNRWTWHGRTNYVRLDPHVEPAHLFVIEKIR